MPNQQNNQTKDALSALFSGAVLGALVLVIAFGVVQYSTPSGSSTQAAAPILTATPSITLIGDAAYVVDLRSGTVLYEKEADAQLPLASVTKLMTALISHEILGDNAMVTITPHALSREGESGLIAGDVWDREKLTDFVLTTSSNDGAQALADASAAESGEPFVALMNARARALGLTQSYFLDATGLDESMTQASAFGSARDVAVLLAHIITHDTNLLAATAKDGQLIASENGGVHTAYNTNEILGEIPGLIGGKTGFTDLAGGNLAIAFDASIGQPIIVVVLGSTKEGRFQDVASLVAYARTALSQ